MVQKLWLRNIEKTRLSDTCDPDHDPVTLVLKLELDIMVTYFHAKNEINMQAKWFKSYGLETLKNSCYLMHVTFILI